MQKQLDDIYVFTFFDETGDTQEIGTSVAYSLEELQQVSKAVKILSYLNISGKDIDVGKVHVMNVLEVKE